MPAASPLGADPSQIDLWVDSQQRLRRVHGVVGNRTIDYDVTDYGVAVDIAPPAGNEIAPPNTNPPPNPYTPVGPFTPVTSGALPQGGTWTVLKAPSASEGSCYRIDFSTPLSMLPFQKARPPESGARPSTLL